MILLGLQVVFFITLYTISWYVRHFSVLTPQAIVSHLEFIEMLCVWPEALACNALAFAHKTWITHKVGECVSSLVTSYKLSEFRCAIVLYELLFPIWNAQEIAQTAMNAFTGRAPIWVIDSKRLGDLG
jgi:hypothetical protein